MEHVKGPSFVVSKNPGQGPEPISCLHPVSLADAQGKMVDFAMEAYAMLAFDGDGPGVEPPRASGHWPGEGAAKNDDS